MTSFMAGSWNECNEDDAVRQQEKWDYASVRVRRRLLEAPAACSLPCRAAAIIKGRVWMSDGRLHLCRVFRGLGKAEPSAIKWDGLGYGRCPAVSITIAVSLASGGSFSCPLSLRAVFQRKCRAAIHFGIRWAMKDASGAAFELRKSRLLSPATLERIFKLGQPCRAEFDEQVQPFVQYIDRLQITGRK